MLSIQTNVDSLLAQQNLHVNSAFQSRTINQLTSGYRINSAADDAAGMAVANGYRNNIAQLTQGVQNANNGVSQLQIVDGGLSNISQILDRLQTLATESASATFTGDRNTLNNEYQSLLTEINRQAANIGLNNGGSNNTTLTVFIGGGGSVQSNSQVTVDLSGAANRVDATGLSLTGTTLTGAGTDISNPTNLNTNSTGLLASSATQVFTLYTAGGQTTSVTVTGTAGGITAANAIQQINDAFSGKGVTASINTTTGSLMFSGSVAFNVHAAAKSGGTGLTSAAGNAANTSEYIANGAASFTAISGAGHEEDITVTVGGTQQVVALTGSNASTLADAVSTLNNSLSGMGVYAVENTAGTGIDFQSASSFTLSSTSTDGSGGNIDGVFASATQGAVTVNAPSATGSSTGNSLSALSAVTAAVTALGLVQGHVGAGENQLNYAITLAQSQITNFSSAQSQIRDANVAEAAANLTKAQVLQQASIAAMAQANAEPQSILALLRNA